MKNQDNKKRISVENPTVSVTATLQEQEMLKNLVERLATRNYDVDYSLEKVQPGSKAFETSSIEAYVSVDISLSENNDLFKIPFITCFLFTFIKSNGGKYDLRFSSSLS